MHIPSPCQRVLILSLPLSLLLLWMAGAIQLVRVGAASASVESVEASTGGNGPESSAPVSPFAPNDVVWVNPVDGDWSVAANWQDGNGVNRVPGSGDNAIITAAGTYNVNLNVNASVLTLTLGGSSGTQALTNSAQNLTLGNGSKIGANGVYTHGGGSLTVSGTLTIDGTLTQAGGNLFGIHTFDGAGAYNWTGGALRGGGGITTIAAGLVMNIGGAADKTLLHGSSGASGHRLVNNGTIIWTGTGNIRAGDASTITNQTGALFDARSDAAFIYAGFGNAVSFINQVGATLRKSSGAGATNFAQFSLNNSGLIDVQTGTLTFNNVSTTHTFNNGTTITGAGAVVINGADPTFTGTININGTLELAPGGFLFGVHTFTGTGSFKWTGGTLRGGGGVTTIAANFLVQMSGTDNKSLNHGSSAASGHRLVNNGTIIWAGAGNIQAGDASTITNQAGGIFDVQTDASFVYQFGNAVSFTNAAGATFRKSGGTGNTVFGQFNFINAGVVDVQTGALVFNNASANHTLNDGTQLNGGGLFLLDGADMTLSGTININGTFEQRTGRLFGTHTLTGAGVFNWTGGSMRTTGTTTVAAGFDLNISGATAKSLLHGGATAGGHKLLNSGTITWTGAGSIQAGDGSFITNQAGGLFDVQTDAGFTYLFGNAAVFTNAAGATFRKSASAGTTAFSANFNFNSSGTVNLQSGTLMESNGFTQAGGAINLSGGNLAAGGTIVLSSGATLGGSGTITANLTNQATINVGDSPGCLNVSGNYTQTAAGALNVEIGGTTPCTQFDRLAVTGTATLNGMLKSTLTNGFTPSLAQTFQVLTFASRTGTFANTTGPFTVNYNATDVMLVSTNTSTITVTTTADAGAGSLRQAIIDANNTAGTQLITFNIPGAGVRTISPATQLPDITDVVVIDGYTQPGASANTLANGNNAVLLIELEGSLPGAGNIDGLRITAGNSTVRGLVINRFADAIKFTLNGGNIVEGNFIGTDAGGTVALSNEEGIVASTGANNTLVGGTSPAARNVVVTTIANSVDLNGTGHTVFGNYIGTNRHGTVALAGGGTGSFGIVLNGSNGTIGGTTAAERNVISGHSGAGVIIAGGSNVTVQGNYIGTDVTGTAPLPNAGGGVLANVSSSVIGGTTAGAGNLIAFNGDDGIFVGSGATGVLISQNSIHSNGTTAQQLGIDLRGAEGVDANDANDADTGTNNLQNFPVLTSATSAGGTTTVQGTLNSTASTQFRLEFFSNTACDSSGNGEGERFLGSTDVTTDALGNAAINALLSGPLAPGESVTATATDPANNTSEFSACLLVTLQTFTISGRVTDGAGGAGVADVPVTLSGAGTQTVLTDAAGNYAFTVAAGFSYTVLPTSPYFVFTPARADIPNIAANTALNFSVIPEATPTPTPPLLDDFESTGRDPDKWNLGLLTQPASAFDPLVSVAQQGGQLVITPRDGAPVPSFNGYVSIKSYDFTGGQTSVEVAKAAGGSFAETSFAIGTDLQNFYRFAVMSAASAPETLRAALAERPGGRDRLSTEMLLLVFQVKVNGVLTQQAIPYDPVQHRFWRFRHDPPQNSLLFETSADNVSYIERFRRALEKGVSSLAVELSAGTTAPSTDTSSAVFDNLSLVTTSAQFAAGDFNVGEGDGRALITVTRAGNVAANPATLTYRTEDTDTFTVGCFDTTGNQGGAYARCDFATAVGTLEFGAGETTKSFTVPLIDDGIDEGTETFNLKLVNANGAALGAPSLIRVTILDNDAAGAPNPVLNSVSFFVRQQYLDFLSREPEAAEPWSGILNRCPNIFNLDPASPSAGCDRIIVSQSFFGSPEFQLKGFYVFRFYKLAFDRLPEYLEVVSDMSFVAGRTPEEVFSRKAQLATLFTERQEFRNAYGGLTNAQYVNALLGRYALTQITTFDPAQPDGTVMLTLTSAELVAKLDAGTLSRAQVLRAVADSDAVGAREFSNAFVGMQYYGYLRRKPDADGFQAWLRVLQSGNVRTMVNGFLNSTEYRLRFGQP